MGKVAGNVKKEIIQIFRKYWGDDFLLIAFGSFAKNQEERSSDIDLAFYNDKPISTKTILEIQEELETEVHTLREIDLINLVDENLGQNLLENILKGGLVWHRPRNSVGLLRNLRRLLINIKK